MYLYRLGCNWFIINIKRNILLVFLSLLCTQQVEAQSLTYNLNKSNGLSTNHIYCAIVDHNGYLWLGTDDGVIRYNGYETVKYDYSKGLPNVDVWDLIEDKHNRIILHSIASEMGYIKNNRYTPFILKGIDTNNYMVFPIFYQEGDRDTSFFWNKLNADSTYGHIGSIVSDTVFFNDLRTDRYTQNELLNHNLTVVPSKGMMYVYDNGIRNVYNDANNTTIRKDICKSLNYTKDTTSTSYTAILKDLIIFYKFNDNKIEYINYDKCYIDTLFFPAGQTLTYIYTRQKRLCVVTNDSIYNYDEELQRTSSYSIDQITGEKELRSNVVSFLEEDTTWGTIVTTYNSGVFLNFIGNNTNFKTSKNDLSAYTYIENDNDSCSYWWDGTHKRLLEFTHNTLTNSIPIQNITKPQQISTYDDQAISLISLGSVLNVSKQKGSYHLFKDLYKRIEVTDAPIYLSTTQSELRSIFLNRSIKRLVHIDDKNFYTVGRGSEGLFHFKKKSDTAIVDQVDKRKYKNLLYDKNTHNIIAYGDLSIIIYNDISNKKKILERSALKKYGINRIEKVFTDRYSNIYIQDYTGLFLLDTNYRPSQILSNKNFNDAIIQVRTNTLNIANNEGVKQYITNKDGTLELKQSFPNTKGLLYNEVHSFHVTSDVILLGTDKGSYEILLQKGENSYRTVSKKFVATLSDSVFNILNNDTLLIPNDARSLAVDVINPSGTGHLTIQYRTTATDVWKEATGRNIGFQALQTGTYNTLFIRANDRSWNSEPIVLTLYMPPLWWQTTKGILMIGLLTLIVIAIVVVIAIITTKRIISRNNEKKNQQRDLELKSIYSQINPHFIFNTLGTAQYFIRKNQTKEAYAHISQFSDLLRAYLRSSRNKYISITEEVENLQNYLQLQLSRFEHKFNYHITVDDKLDPLTTTIPSLLLQPIVENALNHGIFHMEGTGELNIKFLKGNAQEQLICIVEDNGIGRARSKQLRGKIIRKADSYGTILIKELIDTFNKYEPVNIEIEYIDKKEPASGTTVVIHINTKTP